MTGADQRKAHLVNDILKNGWTSNISDEQAK